MTRIATVEYIVPDEAKEDDIFNYIRKNAALAKLKSIKPNPNDPPMETIERVMRITYEARGAQDAEAIEDEIGQSVISNKKVKGAIWV